MWRRLCTSAIALACVTAPALPCAAFGAAAHDRAGMQMASTSGVIVWVHRDDDGADHLVIARADSSGQEVLTPASADSHDIDAQVSPDGRWIAYEHDAPDGDTIHLVRPNGADDHVLDVACADPCGGTDAPTWLSNSQLAYLRAIGPLSDQGNAASAVLFTTRIDGSHGRRLSEPGIDGAFEDRYARLSANGSYIVFQRLRLADFRSALFRMSLHGTQVRQLTSWDLNADLFDLSTAATGPTKDLIVFQSAGRGDPSQTWTDLGFVPATCASVVKCAAHIVWMTENRATGRRTSNPQWSPDGSSLVFTDRSSIDNPNAEIWTVRFGGAESQRRLISTSPNFDYRPAWGMSPC